MTTTEPTIIRHARIDLALWTVRPGTGRPLLSLHGLGESTRGVPPGMDAWPGPIFGLDFTGHGASTIPNGGGYYCEVLMADAALALDHIGEAAVVGRGLGGYIALLLAGARPTKVRGTIIADGPGLGGGGPVAPNNIPIVPADAPSDRTPDPFALLELTRDVRPADYARTFAWQASSLAGLETPFAVVARSRPPWLAEVAQQPGVIECSLDEAIALYRD